MNDLAERKRALVLEAELHRQLLALERMQVEGRLTAIRQSIGGHRWWWMGGAALAGWFVASRAGGLARWLPLLLSASRILRSFTR